MELKGTGFSPGVSPYVKAKLVFRFISISALFRPNEVHTEDRSEAIPVILCISGIVSIHRRCICVGKRSRKEDVGMHGRPQSPCCRLSLIYGASKT